MSYDELATNLPKRFIQINFTLYTTFDHRHALEILLLFKYVSTYKYILIYSGGIK